VTGKPSAAAVDRERDFTTYALVLPFGANALEVAVHPRDDLPRVAAALQARNVKWSPALLSPEGHAGGLIVFDDDDFIPEEVGAIADGLVQESIGAFGYVKDRERPAAFRRVGRLFPLWFGATTFVRGYLQPEDDGIVAYVFGSPRSLLTMEGLMRRHFSDQPVAHTDDDGHSGLYCTMPGSDAKRLFAEIEPGMHFQGWTIHATLVKPQA